MTTLYFVMPRLTLATAYTSVQNLKTL